MKITLNPDGAVVKELQALIKNNGGYCPCASVKNDDTKCMCKSFREQTCAGECHCGLYIKVEEQ